MKQAPKYAHTEQILKRRSRQGLSVCSFDFQPGKEKTMRLDKYLKITRLIKRRTVANEACDAGKIVVNGNVARASYDVKVGDVIEINLGQKPLKVKVLNVTEYATKENAADNYTVIE